MPIVGGSPREQQVIHLLLEGRTNPEIAKELGMAVRTVKSHMNRLFLKYQITEGNKRVKLAALLTPQVHRKL